MKWDFGSDLELLCTAPPYLVARCRGPWRVHVRPHFEVGGMIEDIVWLSADYEVAQNKLLAPFREHNNPLST